MNHYEGVPNKKRQVLADRSGNMFPLSFQMKGGDEMLAAASGTINGAGHLTVTGTVFHPDSVVVASYNDSSTGTAPIAVVVAEGTGTFYGDASTDFYYIVFNQS
jgi:hypothetical protein